jgi:hypothetical protein
VGVREAANFVVREPGGFPGVDNIDFADVFLAARINDPDTTRLTNRTREISAVRGLRELPRKRGSGPHSRSGSRVNTPEPCPRDLLEIPRLLLPAPRCAGPPSLQLINQGAVRVISLRGAHFRWILCRHRLVFDGCLFAEFLAQRVEILFYRCRVSPEKARDETKEHIANLAIFSDA